MVHRRTPTTKTICQGTPRCDRGFVLALDLSRLTPNSGNSTNSLCHITATTGKRKSQNVLFDERIVLLAGCGCQFWRHSTRVDCRPLLRSGGVIEKIADSQSRPTTG